MNLPRVLNHKLEVTLTPDRSHLSASDTFLLEGGSALIFYLGKDFQVIRVTQAGRELEFDVAEEGGLARRYAVSGWEQAAGTVTVHYEGFMPRYTGYGVSVIREDLVELSGFGYWFPTIEEQSQLEQFTYSLELGLPEDWHVVTPGLSRGASTRERSFRWTDPIEDILICAVPHFDCDVLSVGNTPLKLFTHGFTASERERLAVDLKSSVEAMGGVFGPMPEGHGGVVAIVPRGESGAEWGFERGDMWVVGDAFPRMLLNHNWVLPFLPGPMSLSLHETIHAWFGLGMRFQQPWLAEAITQYLQVVLSEALFSQQDLAELYFSAYVERITQELTRKDVPISSLRITDNTYTLWYLKGSWAFWELEKQLGRERVIGALQGIYLRHKNDTLGSDTFVEEFSVLAGQPLHDFFHLWFHGTGFPSKLREEDSVNQCC